MGALFDGGDAHISPAARHPGDGVGAELITRRGDDAMLIDGVGPIAARTHFDRHFRLTRCLSPRVCVRRSERALDKT
jgi:hypothetical protein